MPANTHVLDVVATGGRKAAAELPPLVHAEPGQVAAARKAAEAPDHTRQPTAFAHETYLRLVADPDGTGRQPAEPVPEKRPGLRPGRLTEAATLNSTAVGCEFLPSSQRDQVLN
jgi:hypothetical protein